ncbi:hypothetical protein AB0F43_31560 [Kribbella sp. NPDC023972]|uniref:hypothetical protein n=1 Tax=Kribbella sp. NPDC023972 TaxID=3154795 RepID=UPI0033C388CE
MRVTVCRRYYAMRRGQRVFTGVATPEMIEAIADPATDRCVVIDAAEKVITPDNKDEANVVRPLAEVRIETAETAREFDELASRYRNTLVKAMRASKYQESAALLEQMTAMDPAQDGLAWRIHDQADEKDATQIASAMRFLPQLGDRSADVNELTNLMTGLEMLYPATSERAAGTAGGRTPVKDRESPVARLGPSGR